MCDYEGGCAGGNGCGELDPFDPTGGASSVTMAGAGGGVVQITGPIYINNDMDVHEFLYKIAQATRQRR